MTLANNIAKLLTAKGLRIAIAETSTGGLIAHWLTNVPGSSAYFDRSIVAYSHEAKKGSLAIAETLLKQYGAVSPEIARAMAENVRRISRVDLGLAVTGITGPVGQRRSTKPVGLTYIALATAEEVLSQQALFPGTREEIKQHSAEAALRFLQEYLVSHG
jgi:nicotinamide-nucleotide amidase